MIYGHGIDIVSVDRIKNSIGNNSRFKSKLFTSRETEYCESRKNSEQSFAGIFAVKEAFLKALGTGLSHDIKWLEMEVSHNPIGKPELNINEKANEQLYERKIKQIHISISHEKDYAIGSVILEV
jgi:holo-[acyl-carrier protein] synthase